MKKRALVIGGVCVLALALFLGIYFRDKLFSDSRKADVQPTPRPTRAVFTEDDVMRVDEENRIEREAVFLLFPGSKQEEVVRWLGFPNTAGADLYFTDQYLVEYYCTNGEYIWIRYEWKTEEGWEGYVVESIRITDTAYRQKN